MQRMAEGGEFELLVRFL